MSLIQRLALHEIHKIAAGQVVERPASIVKELIENALDAGATDILVFIKNGGKTSIRVVDNGSGMDEVDAQLSFEKHATSKIRSVDELSMINTFGFRGEALPSIAAVSRVTLITRMVKMAVAVKVTVNDGILSTDHAAGNVGTDITVCDLFYNTPARLKFLKSDQTEQRHIQNLVHAFSFSFCHVSFKLYGDESILINTPAAMKIDARFLQLLPVNFETTLLLPLESTHDNKSITLTGFMTSYQFGTYDRSLIFSFVNGRWVKNFGLASALIKGCKQVLPAGKFPAAVLFLTIDKKMVDINTHPRKEEVLFLHPKIVEQMIEQTVSRLFSLTSTRKNESFVPASVSPHFLNQHTSKKVQALSQEHDVNWIENELRKAEPLALPDAAYEKFAQVAVQHSKVPLINDSVESDVQRAQEDDSTKNYSRGNQVVNDHQQNDLFGDNEKRFIGQLFETYLLIEQHDDLYIIDQHAAHERVLFERFCNQKELSPSIPLLFAHTLFLNQLDFELIIPWLDILSAQGIIVEAFGQQQLLVKAVPIVLKDVDLNQVIMEFVRILKEGHLSSEVNVLKDVHRKLNSEIACKAAIKAGYVVDAQFALQLLKDLGKTIDSFLCPHGRPTGWTITKHELEKKFKRVK